MLTRAIGDLASSVSKDIRSRIIIIPDGSIFVVVESEQRTKDEVWTVVSNHGIVHIHYMKKEYAELLGYP